MPQLTIRGVPNEAVMEISASLVNELAEICDCEINNFTIDCLQVTSIFGGAAAETFPFIEVAWFDRGRETRDRFAAALARRLQQAGIAELEIAFKVYREDSYYINGLPCES